jgi:hypothetical protein
LQYFIFLTMLLFSNSCLTNSQKLGPSEKESYQMEVTSIKFSGSNPSLGPHSRRSSRSLKNLEKFKTEIEQFLGETLVNGVVSLEDYLMLRIDDNEAELQRVHSAYSPELNSGERIIDLEVQIKGKPTVTLYDLRKYRLSGDGYQKFQKLMAEYGVTIEIEDDEYLLNKKL